MSAPAESIPSFPSGAWFDWLVEDVDERPAEYQRLGFADCRFAMEMTEASGRSRWFGLVLDGYEIRSEGELGDPGAFHADVEVSGPLDGWEEMVGVILDQGAADRAHTLNALSIAGFPLCARSSDPMGRDKFYRYAETLQTLFDSAGGRTGTVPGSATPRVPVG
ncbi:MAG: hypothetical protein ACYCV7_10070 [Acidimicrobiales bacterium]